MLSYHRKTVLRFTCYQFFYRLNEKKNKTENNPTKKKKKKEERSLLHEWTLSKCAYSIIFTKGCIILFMALKNKFYHVAIIFQDILAELNTEARSVVPTRFWIFIFFKMAFNFLYDTSKCSILSQTYVHLIQFLNKNQVLFFIIF